MIFTTTQYQRSLTNSWAAAGSNIGMIPAGAILDMQVTMPEYAPVYLTSFRVLDGMAYLILRYKNKTNDTLEFLGSISTEPGYGKPQALTCAEGFTANILIGSVLIDHTEELVQSPIRINPELISVCGIGTGETQQLLTIKQDGVTLISEILDSDIQLIPGSEIGYTYSNGIAAMYLVNPDTNIEAAQTVDTVRKIKSINGVKGTCISIVISVTAAADLTNPVATTSGNSLILDSTEHREILRAVDPIDAAIAYKAGRPYTYYPLDDAYITYPTTSAADGSVVKTPALGTDRDVDGNLRGTYMLSSVAEAGYSWSEAINTLDVMYDSSAEEAEEDS